MGIKISQNYLIASKPKTLNSESQKYFRQELKNLEEKVRAR
jgi:hypothetical protein